MTNKQRIYNRNYMRKKRAANVPGYRTQLYCKAPFIREITLMKKKELLFMVTLINSFLCEKNGGRP